MVIVNLTLGLPESSRAFSWPNSSRATTRKIAARRDVTIPLIPAHSKHEGTLGLVAGLLEFLPLVAQMLRLDQP